jgi:hypothetical protein
MNLELVPYMASLQSENEKYNLNTIHSNSSICTTNEFGTSYQYYAIKIKETKKWQGDVTDQNGREQEFPAAYHSNLSKQFSNIGRKEV